MKRIAAGIMMVCLLIQSTVWGSEPELMKVSAPALDLTAKSAVVMEADTGTVLFEKAKDKKLPPASVTKIMSLLLIFQDLDRGKLKLKDKVTISEHAASMGGSQVFLEPGEEQTVETLIKCVVVSSANDAVVALAEHLAGSEEGFVKRMNQEAKRLGMKHTTFQNACGLDEAGHETTAYDIALMSRELTKKHPKIFKYTKIWMDTITHKTKKGETEFGLSNTNKMIRQYSGCTGLKTGSTSTAKFCLSATATRNGVDLIAVVMASDDSKARIKDATALLDYGFANCQVIHQETTSKEIGKISVEKGKKDTVLYPSKISTKILNIKNRSSKITKKVEKYSVKAPVKKGQTIGMITYKSGGKILKKEKIPASETIEKIDFLTSFQKIAAEYF